MTRPSASAKPAPTSSPHPGTPSPDDKWFLGLDVHVAQCSHWVGAMDGLTPVNDILTTGLVSQTRNNMSRRFFQPMLLDRYGQRGDYQGQQLNGGFDDGPGGISDPNWNARADPAWSPDGTKIVYWQTLVTSSECGGGNPLPCPDSTEPGGRRTRLLIADLVSRKAKHIRGPRKVRQVDSWAQLLEANPSTPLRPILPEGTYTLAGKVRGTATIEVTHRDNGVQLQSVSACTKTSPTTAGCSTDSNAWRSARPSASSRTRPTGIPTSR